MASRVYGYLSKDVRLNNPSYLVWKKRPVGENIFPKFTKVQLVQPTREEEKRLRNLAKRNEEPCFVVKLEGHRVYLCRSSLLTEEEYNEARSVEDQGKSDQKKRRKSKLALLAKSKRSVGQIDV